MLLLAAFGNQANNNRDALLGSIRKFQVFAAAGYLAL
jgi:hypothetical protein